MDLLSVAMDNLAIIRHQAVRLGAGADVDDWVQEVLLHVWLQEQRGVKASDNGHPKSFVLRISQNRLLDIIRSSAHHHHRKILLTDDFDALNPEVADLSHSAEAAMCEMEREAEEREQLAQALEILRHVAGGQMLVEWSRGTKYDDLAARYKLPMGTVKSRLNYAKNAVRRVLSGQGYLASDTPEQKRQRKRAAAQ